MVKSIVFKIGLFVNKKISLKLFFLQIALVVLGNNPTYFSCINANHTLRPILSHYAHISSCVIIISIDLNILKSNF